MARRANTFLLGLVSLYISLDGRIRRSEYWLGGLALNVIQGVLKFVVLALVGFTSPTAKIASFVIGCVFLWPSMALMVKRGHDRGRPAWVSFAVLASFLAAGLFAEPIKILYGDLAAGILVAPVLLVGLFFIIEYAFFDGDPGRNMFGPSPKNPDAGRPLSFDADALPGGNASA